MVKQFFLLTALLSFSFSFLFNCTPTEQDDPKPVPPELVPADSLISYSETNGLSIDQGIGPSESGNEIVLRWKNYTRVDATEFIVYRTSEVFNEKPLNFKKISRFPIFSAQNQNSFRDTVALKLNTDYYYRMTAISGSTESEISNVVSYNLISKPVISYPFSGSSDVSLSPIMEWSLVNASEFLIFVREKVSKKLVWGYITHPPSGYAEQTQTLLYGSTQVENPLYHMATLTSLPLERDKIYEWKVISTQLTTGADGQYQYYSRLSGYSIVTKGSSTPWVVFKTKS